jgi:hypothetical protein
MPRRAVLEEPGLERKVLRSSRSRVWAVSTLLIPRKSADLATRLMPSSWAKKRSSFPFPSQRRRYHSKAVHVHPEQFSSPSRHSRYPNISALPAASIASAALDRSEATTHGRNRPSCRQRNLNRSEGSLGGAAAPRCNGPRSRSRVPPRGSQKSPMNLSKRVDLPVPFATRRYMAPSAGTAPEDRVTACSSRCRTFQDHAVLPRFSHRPRARYPRPFSRNSSANFASNSPRSQTPRRDERGELPRRADRKTAVGGRLFRGPRAFFDVDLRLKFQAPDAGAPRSSSRSIPARHPAPPS